MVRQRSSGTSSGRTPSVQARSHSSARSSAPGSLATASGQARKERITPTSQARATVRIIEQSLASVPTGVLGAGQAILGALVEALRSDPRPWLEAQAAGVGSPLELKFRRLFEQHGFAPQKQVPAAPRAASAPVSVADFALPERRLAIYIVGADVERGANLRRDRALRERLRRASPPWAVVELRAADLGRGAALVEQLRQQAEA